MRKRGFAIGRMYYAHPTSGEHYYLRMLLNYVKGATSYEHLRIVDGTEHNTFKYACITMGLLEDDNEWHQALEEAAKSLYLLCVFSKLAFGNSHKRRLSSSSCVTIGTSSLASLWVCPCAAHVMGTIGDLPVTI